jgi:hypothetical protein
MGPWKQRFAAVGVAAVLVVGASSPVMAAGSSRPAKAPTREACQAFADYFQVEYLVAFAAAFAGLGDKQQAKQTAADIRNTFHLILSPKLERIAETLADGTSPPLHKLFVAQAKAFGKGVALLEGVGLTKAQIQELATVDLKPETDLQAVVGDVDLDEQELERAAKKFGAVADSIDLETATPKEQRAFRDAGLSCGVFPVDVDCSEIVTDDEASALLGVAATGTNEDGTCTYTGESTGRDDAVLAVDVYESSLAFDRLTESAQNQDVPGVGDGATAVEGFNSFSSIKTCGRTLFVKDGERTVVVAVCAGDTPPSAETLAGVTNDVLDRLPPG